MTKDFKMPIQGAKSSELSELFGMGDIMPTTNHAFEEIEINRIADYHNHPYRVINDNKMAELIESIMNNGIFMPLIIRKNQEVSSNYEYECISGNRRKYAAGQLGLKTVPCIIKDIEDDEADILMVDSNNQREELLPSEKAWSYRIKLEAMKRQAGRPKINSAQLEQNLKGKFSVELLASQNDESRATIQRYIRLTYLIPDLLEMVDSNEIKFMVGVELSYMELLAQEDLFNFMTVEKIKPTLEQAIMLKKMTQDSKKINIDIIYAMLMIKGGEIKPLKLDKQLFKKVVPKMVREMDSEMKTRYVLRAIAFYNDYIENDASELDGLLTYPIRYVED